MPCYNPITLKEKERDSFLKIGDESLKSCGMIVPCGKCIGCLTTKRNQWTFRLMEEQKVSLTSCFVTLTYNDENIPHTTTSTPDSPDYCFNKKHVQKFIKRIRKENASKLKYYLISEYGNQTERPHYHAIFFNTDENLILKEWRNPETDEPLGHTHIAPCNQASIHYTTKYMINKQEYAKRQKDKRPFALISKGLGRTYAETARNYHINKQDCTIFYPGGIKQSMPRYYREKIFTEKQLKTISGKTINEENTRKKEPDARKKYIGKKSRQIIIATNNSKSKKV